MPILGLADPEDSDLEESLPALPGAVSLVSPATNALGFDVRLCNAPQ